MKITQMPEEKIIVFGATGNTGFSILKRGIKDGYELTAYVRTPSKLPDHLREKVKIVKGDILKREQVEDAIKGHDVVLSALGTGWDRGPTTLISEGCRNIVSGMKKHRVKKLIVVGVESLIPGHWKPYPLRHLIVDHQRQIDILNGEKDSIDWVALMPPSLWRSNYISSSYQVEKNEQSGRMYVTTGEVTDFMFKCIRNEGVCQEYKHCLAGISSGPALISNTGLVIVALLAVGAGVAWYIHFFT